MKIVLFGGVQGVGKTTLLSWLKVVFASKIVLLDPGELFRRYVYNEKTKSAEEVEELITNKIEEMPEDSVVVVHWHYAVRRAHGYIPQLSYPRLERIAKNNKIEKIVLLTVEAPTDIIRERRQADIRIKARALSQSAIEQEIATDEATLMDQQALFTEALGDRNVVVFRLININLEEAKLRLHEFFESLLK